MRVLRQSSTPVLDGSLRQSVRICGSSLVFFALFSGDIAESLPQFSLFSARKCAACHVNATGGGLRSAGGRAYARDIGLLSTNPLGSGLVDGLDRGLDRIGGGRFSIGMDIRGQSARGHASQDADRRNFLMQATLCAAVKLTEYIDIEASYNNAGNEFLAAEPWTASVILHRPYDWSHVRIGMFRPPMGMRHDDHTRLTNRIPGTRFTLAPPDYAEPGVMYTWQGDSRLTLSVGVFSAKRLAEQVVFDGARQVSLIDDDDTPSTAARVEFRQNGTDWRSRWYTGLSVLNNGDFTHVSLFSGMRPHDRVVVTGEYSRTEKSGIRTTGAGVLAVTVRLRDALSVFLRGGRGVTDYGYPAGLDSETNDGVIGVRLFPFPNLEVRPEYRIEDTEEYRSTRYALQLYLFR